MKTPKILNRLFLLLLIIGIGLGILIALMLISYIAYYVVKNANNRDENSVSPTHSMHRDMPDAYFNS